MMTSGKSSPLTTQRVLRTAFPEPGPSEGKSSSAELPVHVIPQSGEPRWIIVGEPRKALRVLRSWNPWTTASRLRWGLVKLTASIGILPAIPRVENGAFRIETSYWRRALSRIPDQLNAVIHVGTPSHTRKAILFFVDDEGFVECAAKVPLVHGGAEAILNEVAILNRLKTFDNLPRVLFQDSE